MVPRLPLFSFGLCRTNLGLRLAVKVYGANDIKTLNTLPSECRAKGVTLFEYRIKGSTLDRLVFGNDKSKSFFW